MVAERFFELVVGDDKAARSKASFGNFSFLPETTVYVQSERP